VIIDHAARGPRSSWSDFKNSPPAWRSAGRAWNAFCLRGSLRRDGRARFAHRGEPALRTERVLLAMPHSLRVMNLWFAGEDDRVAVGVLIDRLVLSSHALLAVSSGGGRPGRPVVMSCNEGRCTPAPEHHLCG